MQSEAGAREECRVTKDHILQKQGPKCAVTCCCMWSLRPSSADRYDHKMSEECLSYDYSPRYGGFDLSAIAISANVHMGAVLSCDFHTPALLRLQFYGQVVDEQLLLCFGIMGLLEGAALHQARYQEIKRHRMSHTI